MTWLDGITDWMDMSLSELQKLIMDREARHSAEGNGNSLQCSCLENRRDWRAWWAAIYGVSQSRILLKRLSSSSSIHEKSGFPCGSADKESACNAEDLGWIPGLGSSPGDGNGNAFQFSCLENPHGQRSWRATVHGVTKSQTQLSD